MSLTLIYRLRCSLQYIGVFFIMIGNCALSGAGFHFHFVGDAFPDAEFVIDLDQLILAEITVRIALMPAEIYEKISRKTQTRHPLPRRSRIQRFARGREKGFHRHLQRKLGQTRLHSGNQINFRRFHTRRITKLLKQQYGVFVSPAQSGEAIPFPNALP